MKKLDTSLQSTLQKKTRWFIRDHSDEVGMSTTVMLGRAGERWDGSQALLSEIENDVHVEESELSESEKA